MKAVRVPEHGGSEVLLYEDVSAPSISHGDVLVQVKSCAMNHLDLWVRNGMPRVNFNLPRILGSDVSGIVLEIGDGVTGVEIGDEVILYPALYCGECSSCLAGKQTFCRSYRILGTGIDGGNAEFIKVPARNVIRKPSNLTFEEAASVPLVFLTAWHIVVTLGRLRTGENVLIHAAGSGVGIATIQIAKLLGARVFATVSSEVKLDKALELGVNVPINYKKESFEEVVKKKTDGRGVDLVVEHVGPDTWEASIRSLASGGRLVTCGATTGPYAKLDIRHLFSRQLTVLGSYMGSPIELLEVLEFIERGDLKPVVDSVFELRDTADAHRKMESRNHFGKIVINTPESV